MIYRNGRYASKYPFITMKVNEVFTFSRDQHPNLSYTAHKYAERIRDRTGKPFAFKTKTKTVGGDSTTTVKRIK